MSNPPPRTVRFLVSDLVHPHPSRVLMEMFEHLGLEGEVAAQTTDGETPHLIVRVKGLAEPVIVPLNKAQPADPASCASASRHG